MIIPTLERSARGGTDAAGFGDRWAPLGLALVFATFVLAGWWGRDFGSHWDESRVIAPLARLGSTFWLPGAYSYPSLTYDLSLIALLPEWLWLGDRESAREFALSQAFLLRMRSIFVVVTAAGILWTYWLVRLLRHSRVEALVSAAALGLSWELSYHSRWLAADAVLAQFAILSTLLCVAALRRPEQEGWLWLAAGAAGLATGTKYPGGILVVQLIVVSLGRRGTESGIGGRLITAAYALFFFAAAVVMTTPGMVVQFEQFLVDVRYEMNHYAVAGHLGHTIEAGLPHLWAALCYLGGEFFSPLPLFAWLIFALSLIGCWRLVVESKTLAAVVLLAPALYLLFFAQQRVMVVRNLLLLAPSLSVAVGLGAGFVWRRVGGALPDGAGALARLATGRRLIAGVLVGVFATNAYWLLEAASSVADFERHHAMQGFEAHVRTNADTRFALSPRLARDFIDEYGPLPANAVQMGVGDGDYAAVWSPDLRTPMRPGTIWPANRAGRYRVFGPPDVNFDFYPNWEGADRIVVMPSEVLRVIQDETRMPLPGIPARLVPRAAPKR